MCHKRNKNKKILSIKALCFLLALIVIIIFTTPFTFTVEAHPHMFFDTQATYVFDDEGLERILVQWDLDEYTSVLLMDVFDVDGDRALNTQELQKLKDEELMRIKKDDFYSYLKVDNKLVELPYISDFAVSVLTDNSFSYSFTIPIKVKAESKSIEVALSQYDKEYFSELILNESQPVMVQGGEVFAAKVSTRMYEDAFYYDGLEPEELVVSFEVVQTLVSEKPQPIEKSISAVEVENQVKDSKVIEGEQNPNNVLSNENQVESSDLREKTSNDVSMAEDKATEETKISKATVDKEVLISMPTPITELKISETLATENVKDATGGEMEQNESTSKKSNLADASPLPPVRLMDDCNLAKPIDDKVEVIPTSTAMPVSNIPEDVDTAKVNETLEGELLEQNNSESVKHKSEDITSTPAPEAIKTETVGTIKYDEDSVNQAPKSLLSQINMLQKKIQSHISRLLKEAKSEGDYRPVLMLLMLAFVYGAVHVAGPGHGKGLTISYVIADGKRLKTALLLGAMIPLMHSFSGIIVVFGVSAILKVGAMSALDSAMFPTQLVSYGLMILLGGWISIKSVLDWRRGAETDEGSVTRKHGVWGAALIAGIIPCPGVIFILLFAKAMNVLGLGMLMAIAMTIGMIIALSGLTLMAYFSRRVATKYLLSKSPWAWNIENTMELLGGLMIIIFATIFLLAAFS